MSTELVAPAETANLSSKEYFEIPALSYSGMKDLAVSPMRFWWEHIRPDRTPKEETPAMRLGSALHCMVLEGKSQFDARYCQALDSSKWPVCLDTIQEIRDWVASKGGKAAGTKKEQVIESALAHMAAIGEAVPILDIEKKQHAVQNAGKVILTVDEYSRVEGMAAALSEQPKFRNLLDEGKAEAPYHVIDPEFNVPVKCKLDWAASNFSLDLKTFTAPGGKSIDRAVCDAIYNQKYYLQAWLYRHIRGIADGKKKPFIIAFVESDPPHEVRLRKFEASGLGGANLYWTSARTEAQSLMRLYAFCRQTFGDAPWLDQQNIEILEDADLRQFAY